MATTPPMVASSSGGSMASIWFDSESFSCKSASFIPAWTRTIWSPGTYSMISFIRAVLTIRSSSLRRVSEIRLRPATPGRDREPLLVGELHYLADLLDGARLDDEGGLDAFYRVFRLRPRGRSPLRLCSAGSLWIRSSSPLEVLHDAGLLQRVHLERAGPFAAEARGREDLAGVGDLVRVEGAPQ